MTDWMLAILIVLLMLGEFVFGFFVIRRVDRFLKKNAEQTKTPSIPDTGVLSGHADEDEILQALRQYKDHRDTIRVMIYDIKSGEVLWDNGGRGSHAADERQ